MSLTRVEPTAVHTEIASPAKNMFLAGAQFGLTGSGVCAAVLIPEQCKIYCQTQPNATIRAAFGHLVKHPYQLVNVFPASLKASLIKNGVASQSANVHKEILNNVAEQDGLKAQSHKIAAVFTATLLGLVETGFTGYHAALRIHGSIKLDAPAPLAPLTIQQKMDIANLGFGMRWLRCSLNILCCYSVTDTLQESANKLLPPEKFGETGSVLGLIGAGSIAGISTHAIDTVYKNQSADVLRQGLPLTKEHTRQNAVDTVKDLLKQGGVKRLSNGVSFAMLNATIAIGCIRAINSWFTDLRNKENVSCPIATAAAQPAVKPAVHTSVPPAQVKTPAEQFVEQKKKVVDFVKREKKVCELKKGTRFGAPASRLFPTKPQSKTTHAVQATNHVPDENCIPSRKRNNR